jgi:hypothetical protein
MTHCLRFVVRATACVLLLLPTITLAEAMVAAGRSGAGADE